MLGRRPRQVARLSSPSARLTSRVKPRSEISAPGLLTVLWITSSLPRSTSTSVTASLSDLREEIASRCAWLLLRASSISASSSSRSRLRQHGAGDLDRVVEGERADGPRRRGVDRGKAAGQQRARGDFEMRDQALEHVVEQADLLVGIIHRAVDEEVGHLAQRLDALAPRCRAPACSAARRAGFRWARQVSNSWSLSWSVATAALSSPPES